jgi:hypothetical protein
MSGEENMLLLLHCLISERGVERFRIHRSVQVELCEAVFTRDAFYFPYKR